MNAWTWCSLGLMASLVLSGSVALRGDAVTRLVGLEMGSIVACLLLMTLAQAMNRVAFFDLPLALSLLAFGEGLVFARFVERWL